MNDKIVITAQGNFDNIQNKTANAPKEIRCIIFIGLRYIYITHTYHIQMIILYEII